ncbi:hypothetical protein D9M69_410980 [compost metagenome]
MDDVAVAFHQQGQVGVVHLGHVHGLEARAEQAEPGEPGHRPFAAQLQALLDLEGGFLDVHVDAGIQLLGQYADVFQLVIADAVGRVGAEGNLDARMVLEVAEQLDATANGFGSVGGAGDGEVQHRNRQLRLDAGGMDDGAGLRREEIHIGEAADAALDLLGHGQFGAVADEGLVHPLGFGRPDVFLEPGHQRQVVSQPAEQGHRGVAVGVDQARGQQHARQFAAFAGFCAQRHVPRGEQGDTAVADTQCVIPQHYAGRFYRDYPGREQKQVERGVGAGHGGASWAQIEVAAVYPSQKGSGSL